MQLGFSQSQEEERYDGVVVGVDGVEKVGGGGVEGRWEGMGGSRWEWMGWRRWEGGGIELSTWSYRAWRITLLVRQ